MSSRTPTVLLTNDDGPPCAESPFLHGFVRQLREQLGWHNLRVVIPSSQRSWVGKSFAIKEQITGSYYYPDEQDGFSGHRSSTRRDQHDGAPSSEWVLLDGTPATCSNVALHNIYPGEIDLCISGPNYGRNTSSAFALSSGTIGAALAAALCGVPSIALSYGLFQKPVDQAIIDRAHTASVRVISQLWTTGFPADVDRPAVYNVNVPLLPGLLEGDHPVVRFTTMAERAYGRLFTPVGVDRSEAQKVAKDAGPSAVPAEAAERTPAKRAHHVEAGGSLSFKFAPDIGALINPDPDSLIDGTDIHAIQQAAISITPLRAAFAMADIPDALSSKADAKGLWKL